MRVLCLVAAALASAATFAKSVTYDGEFYEHTKGSAPSSTPWVHPTNVVNLASKEAARLISLQQTNSVWNATGLPTLGIWPDGFTMKDYVDFIWNYSILELGNKETEIYNAIDEAIYGPKATLTQAQLNKGIGFNSSGRDENSPIELGRHAVAAIDTNVIAGVNVANKKIRNVGIAIGDYAKTEGTVDSDTQSIIKNQNIAVGFMAYAKGSSMVAIGPGAQDSTETEWTGNSTYAEGSATTAIGYSTKAKGTQALAIGGGDSGTGKPATIASNNYAVAVGPAAQALAEKAVSIGRYATSTASGAVQIGTGTNNTPNSLQFMGVMIVENGRLVGGDADPKELGITQDTISTSGDRIETVLRSGSVVTVLPEGSLGPGTELEVSPAAGDLRNYEVYLPNEPEVCSGLPCGFRLDELPDGIKRVYVGNRWQAHKLPAKVKITQPYSRLVIGEITEMDDGTDWSPIITAAHIKWDGTKFTADGSKLLEGTNLHSGVSLKIKYPISGGTIITREVAGSSNLNNQGILDGTFYNYTGMFEYTPASGETPVATSGTVIPITLIYETKCGTTPAEFTVNYDTLP